MHLDVIPDELRFITGNRTEDLPNLSVEVLGQPTVKKWVLPHVSVEELGQPTVKKWVQIQPTEEAQTWLASQGAAISLERLHVSVAPTKQELFDAVCKIKTLTHLEIQLLRCESLAPIEQLENLTFLVLSGVTKLESVTPISKLSHLTSLRLGASSLQMLDFDREMPAMKCLILLGSSDYSNLKLLDIEFLQKLPNLKYLALLNVGLNKPNYGILDELTELEEVVASRKRQLPAAVIEKLKKRGVNVHI